MNPAIHYRSLRQKKPLKIASGAQIEALHEIEWTADNHTEKTPKKTLLVTGTVEDRGQKYPVEWRFEISHEELAYIDLCLRELGSVIEKQRPSDNPPLELEAAVEIHDWLKAGFVWATEGFFGYFEFKKDNLTLRTKLERFNSMFQLYHILKD